MALDNDQRRPPPPGRGRAPDGKTPKRHPILCSIWSWAPGRARHQNKQAGWPPVAMWLTMTTSMTRFTDVHLRTALCAQLAHHVVDLFAGSQQSSVIIRCTDVQQLPTHGPSAVHCRLAHPGKQSTVHSPQQSLHLPPHRGRRARYTRRSSLPATAASKQQTNYKQYLDPRSCVIDEA